MLQLSVTIEARVLWLGFWCWYAYFDLFLPQSTTPRCGVEDWNGYYNTPTRTWLCSKFHMATLYLVWTSVNGGATWPHCTLCGPRSTGGPSRAVHKVAAGQAKADGQTLETDRPKTKKHMIGLTVPLASCR